MAIVQADAVRNAITGVGPSAPLVGVGAPVSTELMTILFQLGVGTVVGLGGIIAAQRLGAVGGDLPWGAVAPAVAVAGLGVVAGALLLPSG